MFRNTVSTHWSEYLALPVYGAYINFSKGFAVPNYVKSNFQFSAVNTIFKNYDLDICLNVSDPPTAGLCG